MPPEHFEGHPDVLGMRERARIDLAAHEPPELAVIVNRSRHSPHSFSRSRCESSALRSRPYTPFNAFTFLSVAAENGALPSKACNTLPSSRAPSEISSSAASAFGTFSRRDSRRTPVCTRVISFISLSCYQCILVPRYQRWEIY